MPETADVVIIGSGIVGSSVAYNLAQQGCTNVLVIEREAHQGKGSTGKSMGGVRAQFSTPVNIQMSKYSIDFFSKFDEVVGHPADYRAHGYLFCATNENHLAYLKANRERQNVTCATRPMRISSFVSDTTQFQGHRRRLQRRSGRLRRPRSMVALGAFVLARTFRRGRAPGRTADRRQPARSASGALGAAAHDRHCTPGTHARSTMSRSSGLFSMARSCACVSTKRRPPSRCSWR